MAAALIEGGDQSEVSVFQELLRSGNEVVETLVCELIAKLGLRSLITITQPTIESRNPVASLSACRAAIALAHQDFRERLVESWL